jgi:S1-C subfamily serine protease
MMFRIALAATTLFCTVAHAQTVCSGNRPAYGDIGVGMFQCVRGNCLIAGRNHDDSSHVFTVEPTMWNISGAARGHLEDGDALVAIDGIPITTRAAGARLALLGPGTRTTLLVRRDGRELSVNLTAVSSCERPSIQITSSGGGRPSDVARAALRGIDAVRSGAAQTPTERQLDALGIKASFRIDSIVPGSAAAGLGLRVGDEIVAIEERDGDPRARLNARIVYRRQGVLHDVNVTINPSKR